MTCPFHKLKPGLPELTDRISKLPIDERGYPVPWFVAWPDGKPDFRIVDDRKLIRAVKEKLCFVCGQPLGSYKAFVIGPMCSINRTSAEPPNHVDCAEWSVKGCPFLTKPHMVRREDEKTAELEKNVPGEMIKRNPGVMCIWVTKSYDMFSDGRGGILIKIGNPESVSWWRDGRTATRLEVESSIESGLPSLFDACNLERTTARQMQARFELTTLIQQQRKYLPI